MNLTTKVALVLVIAMLKTLVGLYLLSLVTDHYFMLFVAIGLLTSPTTLGDHS